MLKNRIVSSLILWIAFIIIILISKSNSILLLIMPASIMAINELLKFTKTSKLERKFNIIISALFLIVYYINSRCNLFNTDSLYIIALSAIIIWSIFIAKNAVFFFKTTFNFIYITINLHFFFKIAEAVQWTYPTSILLPILVVLITKMADVGGLLVGKVCGSKLIAPEVSPNKTIEGVIGSLIFSVVFSIIFIIFAKNYLPTKLSTYVCMIFTVILTFGAIISDLLESLIKRYMEIKDSDKLIPGIGGVLDLIDSLLLNAPLAYFLFKQIL